MRPEPRKSLPLRTLLPYRAPRLASTRCCFSVGSMGPPYAPRWVREDARLPCPMRAGSCARDAAQRAPTCPEGPARRSPRPCARASLPPAAPRSNSCPGRAGGRLVAAPASPATPARPRPQLRLAPARFIRPPPPRVKPLAARRVQKPRREAEGRPGAQGFPALPPSTGSPAPLGPEEPTPCDLGLGDGCAHCPLRPARHSQPRRSRISVCGNPLCVP